MSSFTSPDLLERRNNAATVKKVMLEKFRVARQEPAFEQQRLKRIAVNEARAFRGVEREAAKKVREAELAAQAARAAELAAQAHREAGKPRRSLRLKRPNAMRRWPRSKKPSAMPGTQHARPQKKSGGAGTSGFRSITAIQYPRWVISGHFAVQSTCPLYPQ